MVQKRHLAEDEYDVSSKHLRVDNISQSVSCLEFPSEAVSLELFTSGKPESCFCTESDCADCALESSKVTDLCMCTKKDVECTLPSSVSSSSRASSMTSDEDMRSEDPLLTPEHGPVKPTRTLVQPEDMYSYLLRCPPLKEVPIGPEFQADIPEWCGNDTKNVSLGSGSTEEATPPRASEANSMSCARDDIEFTGNCVIPMPKVDPASFHNDGVGRGRSFCCCENPGSISCVRQHIEEARENLKRDIGHERFSELGFDDMGEVVADNWSEEEERLFHAVVYSNPASLGTNFWDHLAEVFPSRTNQEIVSYYFNVFMLRRRAEQNRCNSMDIDSDDDELHSSDDEDSCRDEIPEYDSHKQWSGIENPIFSYYEDVGFLHGFKESTSFAETQPRKLPNSCSFDSSQPSQKTLVDECGADHDFQDDSCTSSDTGAMTRVSEVKSDNSKSWSSHDFILEPSDSRGWEVGYFSCPRLNTDFLPTGSMIEEVFGVGSWNFKVRDNDKGSS